MTSAPEPARPLRPQRPASPKQELGIRGEQAAADYLARQGWTILERNWTTRQGELDLIAKDGASIVAVEVKTRSGLAAGHPLEAITPQKVRRLRRLLAAWAHENRPRAQQLRIDAVGIIMSPESDPHLEHIRGIQ